MTLKTDLQRLADLADQLDRVVRSSELNPDTKAEINRLSLEVKAKLRAVILEEFRRYEEARAKVIAANS